MEISLQTANLHEIKTSCLVIPVLKGKSIGPIAEALDKKTRGVISKTIELDNIKKKIGANVLINNYSGLKADRLMLVNCGSDKALTLQKRAKIILWLSRCLYSSDVLKISKVVPNNICASLRISFLFTFFSFSIRGKSYRFCQIPLLLLFFRYVFP